MKKILTILLIAIAFSSNAQTYTIGASLDNFGSYIATENFLIFYSNYQCQIWSRTAGEDAHFSSYHLHYNASDDIFLTILLLHFNAENTVRS